MRNNHNDNIIAKAIHDSRNTEAQRYNTGLILLRLMGCFVFHYIVIVIDMCRTLCVHV